MSEVKYNFLNWNPDKDDFDNEGLIVADNMIHDVEGYLPVGIQTVGAFSTVQSGTIEAHAIPYGNAGQLLVCQVRAANNNVQGILDVFYSFSTSYIFLNNVTTTATLSATVLTLEQGAAVMGISSFSLVDTGSSIFYTAEAEFDTATGTPEIINVTGYSDYS